MRYLHVIADAIRDLRVAVRRLARVKTFTVVVVLTLAVGIGVNAAVLSIIDTGFVRKLPVPAPERIVGIWTSDLTSRRLAARFGPTSYPDFEDVRGMVTGLDDVAAYAMASVSMSDSVANLPVFAAMVSPTYFHVLGVRPVRGRLLDAEHPAEAVIVISHALWRSQFNGAEDVVGRHVMVGSAVATIVGIAPAGFTGLHPEGRTDAWIPIQAFAAATGQPSPLARRDWQSVFVFGRLAPQAQMAGVQLSLDRASHELAARYPVEDRALVLKVSPRDQLISFERSPDFLNTLAFCWLMVALVHLAACSNVASLMLVRGFGRTREYAVRACLGASPRRVIAFAAAEPFLLSFVAALVGLGLSRWLVTELCSMQFLSALNPGLTVRGAMIVLVVSVVTAIEFGVLPTYSVLRRDPAELIRGASGAGNAQGRRSMRSGMVIVQLAVGVCLTVNAAVLAAAFARGAIGSGSGYDADKVLMVSLDTHDDTPASTIAAVVDELTPQIANLPGVQRVAVANGAPLVRAGGHEQVGTSESAGTADSTREASVQLVGAGYFATIGAAMRAGREFVETDRLRPGKQRYDVAVVNESFANAMWHGESPLGRTISARRSGGIQVVGVVRDLRDVTALQSQPRVYLPLRETEFKRFEVLVQVAGDPSSVAPAVRRIFSRAPVLRVGSVQTLGAVREDALMVARVTQRAVGACALLTLLLGVLGLYGLMSMWVLQRRAELGIRLALGATPRSVVQLIIGAGLRLTVVGIALGIALSLALIQAERAAFGPVVQPIAWVVAVTTVVFAVIALATIFVPARRSASLDPAISLRTA